MRGVLFVPGLGINLYSIGSATDAGIEVHFANNTVVFSHNKVVIMEGKRAGKEALYHLNNGLDTSTTNLFSRWRPWEA